MVKHTLKILWCGHEKFSLQQNDNDGRQTIFGKYFNVFRFSANSSEEFLKVFVCSLCCVVLLFKSFLINLLLIGHKLIKLSIYLFSYLVFLLSLLSFLFASVFVFT